MTLGLPKSVSIQPRTDRTLCAGGWGRRNELGDLRADRAGRREADGEAHAKAALYRAALRDGGGGGSFSAVSTPIFTSKYALCSIFQNLPDHLAEIFEIKFWQNFPNFATFAKCC